MCAPHPRSRVADSRACRWPVHIRELAETASRSGLPSRHPNYRMRLTRVHRPLAARLVPIVASVEAAPMVAGGWLGSQALLPTEPFGNHHSVPVHDLRTFVRACLSRGGW